MVTDKSFKIFVDFDGTISKLDVGEHLFLEFGDKKYVQNLIDNWNNDQIDSCSGWRQLCSSVDVADKYAIENYLSTIEIDQTFKQFVDYCSINSMDLKIISDGFDFYINNILDREGLSNLNFSANILEFTEDKKLAPFFPNAQEDCNCCANCKRNFVLDNSSDDDYTVYIGDGQSDRCPVQYCDFIFAKDSLLKFCEVNRITYFPYSNFIDVIKKLDELKSKKRLKKRYQAELKRKEVFIQG